MNKDVFLAGIIGVVLGLLILPLSLQPFGLIAVPAVVAVVGSLAAKALLIERKTSDKRFIMKRAESPIVTFVIRICRPVTKRRS